MASDIQRLRQQALFNIAPQMDMGGGMDMGGNMGGYAPEPMNYMQQGPMGGRYQPPPIGDEAPSSSPFDFMRPSTGPTFPNGGTMDPRAVQGPGGRPASTVPGGMTLDEYIDAINKGYTPDFTDRDRMRGNLDAAPVRGRPSLARSLVAAALSTKAEDPIGTAEKVQYAPHYRAMADWTAKNEPFYKAADLENRQNINERTLISNAVASKTAADRLAENARQADEKTRVSEIRARAYAWKQMHPDWDWDTTGPTYVLKGPNGEVKDTGIKTGNLGDEDLQLLKNKGAVAAATARGSAAVTTAQATAQAAGRGLIQIGDKLYEPDPDNPGSYRPVQGVPPGVATRPGTPPRTTGTGAARTNTLETRRQIQDRMAQLYQTDPISKQYMRKTAGGGYDWKDRPVVSEASGIWPFNSEAVTQEQVDEYDQVRSEVDPSYRPPARTPKGLAPTNIPPADNGRGAGPGRGANPNAGAGTGRGGGPPSPEVAAQQQRAAEFLRKNGKPVTQANVDHAIRQGWVK